MVSFNGELVEERNEQEGKERLVYEEIMPLETSAVGTAAYINAVAEESPRESVEIVIKEKITAFEQKRKELGMSVEEFYAAPRDPPSESALPIFDAAHVRNAMARFNQTHFRSKEEKIRAYLKILRAAKKFGIDIRNFEKLDPRKNSRGDKMVEKEEEMVKQEEVEQEAEPEQEQPEEVAPEKKEGAEKGIDVNELLREIESLRKEVDELRKEREIVRSVEKEVVKEVSEEKKGIVPDQKKRLEEVEEYKAAQVKREILKLIDQARNEEWFQKFFS